MRSFLLILACGLAAFGWAQTDHDNLDAGRPLRFEDAEPIALGGMAIEFGFFSDFRRGRSHDFGASAAFIWGGAMDTQFEVGSTTLFGGGRRNVVLDGLHLSALHSLRREIRNSPALAVKLEADLPTSGEKAVYSFRGIASKAAKQYDRLHLNIDVDWVPDADAGTRNVRLGAVLGYTKPLGYFTHFDTTALAELSIRQGESNSDPVIAGMGLGIRRQVSPRSVLDLGIQAELSGRERVPVRLVAGYSTSF